MLVVVDQARADGSTSQSSARRQAFLVAWLADTIGPFFLPTKSFRQLTHFLLFLFLPTLSLDASSFQCFAVNGDAKAKATDFANYFCSYAQLYHQKQMLADHQRMAAYHSAILGNQDVFRDKVVMDIGTGSGILAVWAAQAGARKVYAIEYTVGLVLLW